MKILKALSFIVIGGVGASVISSHKKNILQHCKSKVHKKNFIINHIGKKLNLSDSQKSELKYLFSKIHGKMKEKKKEHEKVFEGLKTDFINSDFDANKYSSKFKEHILSSDTNICSEALNEVHQILDETQRIMFIDLLNKHKHHHHCCN